ncbi:MULTISPECIES: precorrin-6A reductase [Brevibacillus]|jgi:precorrin-6A/cobalt-precorrin-6A reductase|uniref:Precorrin-6x reductase n=2 Tax=Bacillati TaxID=1783272 RepID=M8DI31_9BACL|nr:precorrin-6A reductase [Brevibacillus borstelensis]EMT53213.1 precorrin-6x reductase [Brevibacillus borstelensis AK1]KKX55400.1 precorrin-6x reductase [Brevibacillus borstelensis cifa_chp40]MBE5397638.1 precorrin-6A reductase [Brevibacillus borstelensis]MCC0563638.1 precorrin-6A reductase [Brevibacillus borstelensis]MCM3469282.1 precorrin-6A reductase [Brevibacillus borstelensis]
MILVLAGTSDARELALLIKETGYDLLATVVTDNAAKSIEEAGLPVQVGRLTSADIEALIREKGFQAVVDASHPYAEEASKNAMAGAEAAGVPYIRYERESAQSPGHEKIIFAEDYVQAAEIAAEKRGVIMLTTGSKTLKIFSDRLLGLPDTTLVARMLPRTDNMQKCEELGIEQKNIVAMQGPFSKELNKALYDHYKVTLMITKESGKVGAFDEKVEAALEMGIETIVIARPKIDYGTKFSDFAGVIGQLKQLLPLPQEA